MNTIRICSALVISALLALAVFTAPVAAASASITQLNSFSRLNGFSSGTGAFPSIPDSSGVVDDILPADPVIRVFSPTGHNMGAFTIQPYVSDMTAAQFARTVGPRIRGYCGW
ncbi:MAG TPA: hypothetical protein VMW63_10070 [Methanoregulaceae archaeon]|nr:hypothetical protein [Methanoregulaceae archaeon]